EPLDPVTDDADRIGAVLAVHRNLDLAAELLELVDRRGTLEVRRHERRRSSFFAQQQRQLGRGSGLAGALQPGEEDHGRRAPRENQLRAARAHQRRQLLVDGLHDLLARRDALQDLLTERALPHLRDEVLDDLAGSTALADDQDPERTRARLERFYDAMSAEIEAAGGTIEKFVGDAVMAAFGAPEALEDHAERALHTALSMQRQVEEGLTLRIGVNTGEVVAGRAREGSSFVSGDAVNVAARLEQAADPGDILVAERTAAAARGAFEFGDERTVEAKGKSGGGRCRPLVRALPLRRTRGLGGRARTFVGREAELERLVSAYRRSVERSHPVLVTVLGDPGLGKTRLMRELWE